MRTAPLETDSAWPNTPHELGLFLTRARGASSACGGRRLEHIHETESKITGPRKEPFHDIQAIYFDDPDGNGVEVYLDTRSKRKTWEGKSSVLDTEKLLL